MKSLKYFFIVGITCFPFHSAYAYVTKTPYKLDSDIALQLLIAADPEAKQASRQISYDGITFDGPAFYTFSSVFDRDAYDYWSINPWTGDVWSLWTCEKETTSASLKLQAKIRKRFTPEEMKQYDLMAAVKPRCQ